MNLQVYPRTKLASNTIHLLWSPSGNMDNPPNVLYQPNHFVPIFIVGKSKRPKLSQTKIKLKKVDNEKNSSNELQSKQGSPSQQSNENSEPKTREKRQDQEELINDQNNGNTTDAVKSEEKTINYLKDHVIYQFFINQSESSNSCAQLHSSVGRKFLKSLKNGDVTMMLKNFSPRTQRN